MSKVKYYKNKDDYFLCSNLDINVEKLIGVTIIESGEEAEKEFKKINGIDEEDGVYIPEIFKYEGVVYGTDLNTMEFELEESPEDYINNYII
jgi:hypothetical protein